MAGRGASGFDPMTVSPAYGFWDELTAGLLGSVVVLDQRLIVLAVNARWLREFGRPAEEAVGRAYFDMHPQAAQWLGVFEKGLAGETVKGERIRVVTDGEDARLIDASIVPRRNTCGEVIGLLLISNPTAAAHDSAVSRAAEERLTKALAQAGVYVWELDHLTVDWRSRRDPTRYEITY